MIFTGGGLTCSQLTMIRRIACQQLNRRFWRIRCQLHHILYLTISCSVIYILVPARYPKFTYRADVEDKWRLVSGGYYTNNINRNASRGSTQGTSGKETGTLCPIWLSSLGEPINALLMWYFPTEAITANINCSS
jgi:hypothetical protein